MFVSAWKLFSISLSSFSLGFSVCSLCVSLIRRKSLKNLDKKYGKSLEISDKQADQSDHNGSDRHKR